MPHQTSTISFAAQPEWDRSIGTLLWIGDRRSIAFQDCYAYCDANVSQLAYRRGVEDALARPASDVNAILVCRENDSAQVKVSFDALLERYPAIEPTLLLGPLCAGCRPNPIETLGGKAIWWHDWQSRLPKHLQDCGVVEATPSQPDSIAIVTRDHAMGEALAAMVEHEPVTTLVCDPEQLVSTQNFAEYWWDDSAIKPSSFGQLEVHKTRNAFNVWIANQVSPLLRDRAIESGFDQVIAKPGDFGGLLRRVRTSTATFGRNAA
ncbi:hypothetical protein LOC67_05680 [Stieleria sp. JC731]|uniref:hypothetical protein n=1 Tax=Pirellulaceae TaxID=2691357 RepID=UPI001E569C24|nr:hypothetical protein [Stieleria sp. JC731]MCC9600044.1 hypothetical protein [Stieleria sp. JC731]